MYAVIAPVLMKVATATSDLRDRLGRPHNPCPEVQPDPNRVPNPVNSPATTIISVDSIEVWWSKLLLLSLKSSDMVVPERQSPNT